MPQSVSRKPALRALWVVGAMGISTCVAAQTAPAANPSTTSNAQQPVASAAAVQNKRAQVGDATRKLMELQASGVLASEKSYPVSVDVAERIYQRYLESFSHPIAEKLDSTLKE